MNKNIWKCFWCELCCTFFLLFVGTSVGAQTVLSKGTYNDYLSNTIGWSITLMFAIMLGQRISGAHLNPAVSFFHWSIRRIDLCRFILYTIAQVIGAFGGAALTYLNYIERINAYDDGVRSVYGPIRTAQIFTYYPDGSISFFNGVLDQVIGTALIVIIAEVVKDPKNQVPVWMQPTFIGTGLAMIGMGLSLNAGYIINPARDLGPRIFSMFIYGSDTFSDVWWLIPLFAPFPGALLGGWVYKYAFSEQLPETDDGKVVHNCINEQLNEHQI